MGLLSLSLISVSHSHDEVSSLCLFGELDRIYCPLSMCDHCRPAMFLLSKHYDRIAVSFLWIYYDDILQRIDDDQTTFLSYAV